MHELQRAEFDGMVVRESGYPAGGRMGRHAHDFSNVTAVINGEMEERTDSGEHRGRSCSVLVKPAGTLHENVWLGRRGTRTVSVELRDKQFDTWRWLEDSDTARAALALADALRRTSREAVESCAVALVALATNAPRGETTAPAWLAEVKRTLDTRFDEPLRFEELADGVGLHPVYLSRAFRRHMGVAMGEYVRALRLRHARHLLSATAKPLTAVSAESGFTDASHLCRVFTSAHGLTAAAFRRITV
ncbi:MAG TPA: helix-turn-helix domain-containing protein [Thermoanaerobaculia bacterium]|nr:helix-turn-helix domain-containing protein [Thermoanaerobaculia bacterium]